MKNRFYCYRRTVAPDFLGGGLRWICHAGECRTERWELVQTCDIQGKHRKWSGVGARRVAEEITIKQTALWYSHVSSLSVKSCVVPGCQNCRRIYTNFFSLVIDLIYFTIHSLGFRFYVNVIMIFFFFFLFKNKVLCIIGRSLWSWYVKDVAGHYVYMMSIMYICHFVCLWDTTVVLFMCT